MLLTTWRLGSACLSRSWPVARVGAATRPTFVSRSRSPGCRCAHPGYKASKAALCRGPAAVDREVGAGDLRGVVAAQEQRQGSDLFGGDELLGRLRRQQHIVDDLLLGQV